MFVTHIYNTYPVVIYSTAFSTPPSVIRMVNISVVLLETTTSLEDKNNHADLIL
jgi:hypothetical protein